MNSATGALSSSESFRSDAASTTTSSQNTSSNEGSSNTQMGKSGEYSGGHFVTTLSEATTYVSKSPDALRRAFVGLATLIDLVTKTLGLGRVKISPKAQEGFETCANFFQVTRVWKSLDYFTGGTVEKDWDKGGGVNILSESAYLVARIFAAIVWAAKQGLLESWAIVAAQTGKLTFFGQALEVISSSFFIFGMGCTIAIRAVTLCTKYGTLSKNDVAYNIVDLLNNSAETAVLSLILAGAAGGVLVGLLALVAASCGIAASLLDPQRPL